MGWGSPHTPTGLPRVPTTQLTLPALLCTVATFWVTLAGVCLARWLCLPLPGTDHSAPLPTPRPAFQTAWHQGSTFWKVTDLFWGGGGHRSMSRGHPGRALGEEHACLHRSFTPLPAPGDTAHPLPLPLLAGQQQLLSPHLLPELGLPLPWPSPSGQSPCSPARVLQS